MPQPSDTSASPWTSPQLDRLKEEWRRLQRSYAFHPFVRIVPLEGEPPVSYRIEYRVRTLEIDAAGQLGYAPTCTVELTLPVDFPHGPPHVRPTQAIFHPNVDMESVQLVPAWEPSVTLVELVERVGRLLAFQNYDPQNLWNPVAMQWVSANAGYVPTDSAANLSPGAGGEPLERIGRSGESTLAGLREQLRKFSESLLDPTRPPSAAEVGQFAQRTRLALSVFLDGDIPANLAKPAQELAQWTAALPAAEGRCAAFRKMLAGAQTSATLAAGLVEAVKQVNDHLANIDQMATEPPTEPRLLLKQLPLTADLQKSNGLFRGLLAKAEQRFTAARAGLAALELPAASAPLPELLQALIDAEQTRRASTLHAARAQLQGTLQSAEPIMVRARREAAALEQILLWREYADMRERTQRLTRLAMDLGAAGMQAYFMTNEGGRHGPFEFEQQVDLGTAQIAIHNVTQKALEAIDLQRGTVIGRTAGGDLPASVPGAQPGESFPTTFRPTATCDDVALQLEYAVGQTRSMMDRLSARKPVESPASWSEKYNAALGRPEIIAAFVNEHRATSGTWASLASDLRSLAPFKDRIATYHLLVRALEAVPRHQKELADATAAHQKAEERIAQILARSSKDVETGSMIIPSKFHKEYETLLDQSDRLHREMGRATAAINGAAAHVKARMAIRKVGPSPIGVAKVLKLKVLPPMPAELGDLPAAMSDWAIVSLVTELEGLLGVQVYFGKRPTAPPEAPAAPPPAPATSDAAAEPAPPELPIEETHEEQPHAEPAPAEQPVEEYAEHATAEHVAEHVEEHAEAAPEHHDGFAVHDEEEHEAAEESDHIW